MALVARSGLALKRIIDIVVSGAALLVGLPFLFLLACAVAIESGFPVLYRQTRVGRGAREFQLLKFRSMRPDGVGPSITVSGDKRVTRVGRYLRASKLDEFPQLWNVLIGEMSLVGPRPEVPEYVELFRLRYEHILSVRPGITDLASIRFRGEERILAASQDPLQEYVKAILPQKLTLAEEYIRRRSVWLDLWILLKTVSIVFWPDPVS